MRVFLDTNVLVAAVATRGLCSDVVRHALAEHELLVSEQVLAELRRALQEKLRVPTEVIDNVESLLRAQTLVATPRHPDPVPGLADRDDVRILAAAVAARADIFVTGDADVLGLGSSAPVPVRSPRQFWDLVSRGA